MSFAHRQLVITRLMKAQQHTCAGPYCSTRLRTPVIDHDHDTDLVRGLLCGGCNTAEGRANNADEPGWVQYRSATPAMSIGLRVMYGSL